MQPKCLQSVVPHNDPLPSAPTLRMPHHPQSQVGGDCGVSGTDKKPSVTAHDHLPIAGRPTKLPTDGDKIIYCTSQQPLQGCYLLFSVVLEFIEKEL